jgi:hypothetical protein
MVTVRRSILSAFFSAALTYTCLADVGYRFRSNPERLAANKRARRPGMQAATLQAGPVTESIRLPRSGSYREELPLNPACGGGFRPSDGRSCSRDEPSRQSDFSFSSANSCTDDHCRIHRGRQAEGQSQRSERYSRPSPSAPSRLNSWYTTTPTGQ